MIIGFCVQSFLHMFVSTPGYAMCMNLAAPQLRGTTAAILQVLSNLIGFGIGPMVGGVLSDLFRPYVGDDSLRYALGIYVFLILWAVYHLIKAGGSFAKDAQPLPEAAAA